MTEAPSDEDVMQQRWCCLACSSTFRFGQLRMRGGGLHCPRCDALAIHPATGETVELDRYDGEIGMLN